MADHESPDYDSWTVDDGEAPRSIYVNQLQVVLVGERIFLADETNHSEIRDEISRHVRTDADLIIWPLPRPVAARFAHYLNWEAVLGQFPDDHPIWMMPIPEMPGIELARTDPRLADIDLEAIRLAEAARRDQSAARLKRSLYSRQTSDPSDEMPPLA